MRQASEDGHDPGASAAAAGASPWGEVARGSGAIPAREVRLAAVIQSARRKRDDLFGAALFADPAWDMLLDLFIQEAHGRTVFVSGLCAAAAVPTTTALRWIGTLSDAKLVERRPTGSNRKVEIRLSRRAHQLVSDHLRDTAGDIAGIANEDGESGAEAEPQRSADGTR